MFVDQTLIHLKGGNGGNGVVAFRREKYVPEGGPAGGNGGNGGNIILEVENGLRTLIDFRFKKNFFGKNGESGANKSMHGKNADDVILKVPPGTIVLNSVTKERICDLTDHKQQFVVAKGGRGGRGNTAFASSRNPAPHISENGEPGEEKSIMLELKLLADIGFVGFPSVGKSTLLSVMTAAKPKIAAYHFTTLSPQLGVASTSDDRSFVVADLPGLIEGAHLGHGLGLQFLKHIERTKVILHVLDMSASEGRDPYDDYTKICEELRSYDTTLLDRRQIIVANKMDVENSFENLEKFKKDLNNPDIDVVEVSGITQYGVNVLKLKLANILDALHEEEQLRNAADNATETITYTLKNPPKNRRNSQDEIQITIEKQDNGSFIIVSEKLERMYQMTNMNYDESVMRFVSVMRAAGVDEKLRESGAREGDTVWISDFAFDFVEEEFDK
ncbi:GTPase Obg [Erysipelotrichaceae bacterium]|nr:GTPase Obg [Erysipelotrichaceae bacterium]